MRVGLGFDVHAFASHRRLVLGGVEIPHDKGLLGHSDADVVLHAVMDAVLGALALGDIGHHFPNTDERFKDADSRELCRHVYRLICEQGYSIGNMDVMIMAEQPKIGPYIPQMRECIAALFGCDIGSVSIKATTMEGMGFVGRKEGIAAQAVVLLMPRERETRA
jgi:2-C-methyl-D-erythritol 2,4-cyclodiphosphate synthase